MKNIKKLCAGLLAAAICLIGASCSKAPEDKKASAPAQPAEVTLTVQNAVSNTGDKILTAKWQNNSDDEIRFGRAFKVEKQNGDEWTEFAPAGDVVFTDEAHMLSAKGNADLTYDLSQYNFTEAGRYRVKTEYSVNAKSVDNEIFAEFNVE